MITMFRMILGDLAGFEQFSDSEASSMVMILCIVFIVFVVIILLNLLIAIMGDAYDRVSESREGQWYLQLAQMLAEYEETSKKVGRKTKLYRLLARWAFWTFWIDEEASFPKWLQVLQKRYCGITLCFLS